MMKKESLEYKQIPTRLIDSSPFGIRQRKDPGELGGSMLKLGVLSPIRVRPKGTRFETIFGDRRLEQAKKLGLKTIDAIVDPANDREALLQHIVENCSRKDFNPMEEADAFQRLREIGYTVESIAKLVGKSNAHISARMALLRLPEKVQLYVAQGKLQVTLAQLIAQGVPAKFQEHVADTIVTQRYEFYQAYSYLESMRERFRLDKLTGRTPEMPERKTSEIAQRGKKKEASHDWVDEEKAKIENKLLSALSMDAFNITSLEIWKQAMLLEPQLRKYKLLYVERFKVRAALKADLELVEQKAKKIEAAPLKAA